MKKIPYLIFISLIFYSQCFGICLIGSGITSGGSGGTTFVSDTFSGEVAHVYLTAHTGEIGASWTQVTGSDSVPQVSWDQLNLYSFGSITQAAYASGIPNNANYSVQADVIPGVSFPGILARVSISSNTFYMARFSNASLVQLYKAIDGTFTLLSEYDGSYSSSTSYVLKLKTDGTSITVDVDGINVISVTDSSITEPGRAGIRFVTSSDTTSRIDNLVGVNL